MSLTVSFDTQNQKIKPKSKTTIRQTNPVIGEKLNGGAKVNGIIEHFKQGEKAGDCRALAQLIGLSFTTIGKKAIKDSVRSDGMGGAIVTFKGAKGNQKEFRISIEEFNRYENGKIYSKGDDDVLCIEIAMVKYLKSLGVKIPKDGIQGHEVAELGENELVELLMGENIQRYDILACMYDINGTRNVEIYLKEFEKNPNKFICEIGFTDNFDDEIYINHAYALKRIEKKNGKKYVIFINPYNSTKELKMEYTQFVNSVDNTALYELNSNQRNRNLLNFENRKSELWNLEKAELELKQVEKNKYQSKDGLWWDGNEYQAFTNKIKYAKIEDVKKYINNFSDLQRYIIMKNYAETYISKLDHRTMGWSSEKIQNKKDVIQPFIDSAIKHAKLYGISDKDINEFKNACAKELNAKFYTNQSKIIEAFEKFIKIVENAKEEYYEGCHY